MMRQREWRNLQTPRHQHRKRRPPRQGPADDRLSLGGARRQGKNASVHYFGDYPIIPLSHYPTIP